MRRARVIGRFLRIDTPALWRSAAHVAVLVLSVGVYLVSRYPVSATAVSASAEAKAVQPLSGAASFSVAQMLLDAATRATPGIGADAQALMVGTDAPSAGSGSGSALGTGSPALAAATGTEHGFVSPGLIAEADSSRLSISEPQVYAVQDGDNVTSIAQKFGIKEETILYANPDLRNDPHDLDVGQQITILPVDGVLHKVKAGETVEGIAKKYKAVPDQIVEFGPNGLKSGRMLVAGAELVVPGGTMELTTPSYKEALANRIPNSGGNKNYPPISTGNVGPAVGSGSFAPGAYGSITNRFSRWHPAVDIANHTGTPIYAIDGGTVVSAGWGGGGTWAGISAIIDHGNGYRSLYAHMSAINVVGGQTIQRGQIIGAIGCTRGAGGRCTGPHLHLEVYYHGARINACSVGACP